MSLLDAMKTKKKAGVRQLIGAASIEDSCLVTFPGEKIAYLILTPSNLSILPLNEVRGKIKHLTAVLDEIGSCDALCLNSTQSYDHNKRFITRLRDSERNKILRDLDQRDIQFLDEIQIKMATNRQFLLVLHFTPRETIEHIEYVLKKALQILKDNQFAASIATREDIKRCLAIYLEQDIYGDTGQDYDGEKYLKVLEMSK